MASGLGGPSPTLIVTAGSSATEPRTEIRLETTEDAACAVDAAGGAGDHYV